MVKLWLHQENAVELGKKEPDLALLFSMGTGKTLTALSILRYRINQHQKILRTLIIGPCAVLHNWKSEIEKFTKIPLDKVFVLEGALKQRIKMVEVLPKDSIFITNTDAFSNNAFASLFQYHPPEFLIVDESHKYKGITSLRTKALIKISDSMQNNLPFRYRMILSGTPVLNNELDVFAQYRILDGGKRFGKNFFQFRANFFEDKNRFMPRQSHFPKWQPKPETREKLKMKMAEISLTATKEECLDLPPFIQTSLQVQLGSEQKNAYDSMKKEFVAFCKSGVATAALAITKMLRLQQILSGFMKLEDGTIHRFKENPRADALSEMLEDIVHHSKAIVWGIFIEDYKTIEDVVKGLKVEYANVTGLTKNKQEEITRFQTDKKCRVMIASQAAAGTGVNLTEASYMLYYSRGYSLEHDLQSEARAFRAGSEIHKKITRIDLVAEGTVDVQILEALKNKKDLSVDILQLANSL